MNTIHKTFADRNARLHNGFLAIAMTLLTGCACTLTPSNCHLFCGHKASDFDTNAKIASKLRCKVNAPLNCLAKTSGILTTSLGKNFGIRGWIDLKKHVDVAGKVIHAAYSTDQFYTVDMRIESIRVNGEALHLNGTRFIRAEICIHCIPLSKHKRPMAGDEVHLSGKLKWDSDGFLEVHPQKTTDVRIVKH